MKTAKVYLIPSLLGESEHSRVLPLYNLDVIRAIDTFVVENEKSARKFIKQVCPEKVQADLDIYILNKDTEPEEMLDLIKLLDQNKTIGIISEAGLPAVADPGAQLVKVAQQKRIKVVPLIGPSSILLALMASGANGQNFAFKGYLPAEKGARLTALKALEQYSRQHHETALFIETPYRNDALLADAVQHLHPNTRLCVACDLTLPSQTIISKTIDEWRKLPSLPDLKKRPTIFVLWAA